MGIKRMRRTVLIQLFPRDLENLFAIAEIQLKIRQFQEKKIVLYIADVTEFLLYGIKSRPEKIRALISNILEADNAFSDIVVYIQSKILNLGTVLVLMGKWFKESDLTPDIHSLDESRFNQLNVMTVLLLDVLCLIGCYDCAIVRHNNNMKAVINRLKRNSSWKEFDNYLPSKLHLYGEVFSFDIIDNLPQININCNETEIEKRLRKIPVNSQNIKFLSCISVSIYYDCLNEDYRRSWEGKYGELKRTLNEVFLKIRRDVNQDKMDRFISKIIDRGVYESNLIIDKFTLRIKQKLNF
ncbi:hypothetical protein [Thermoactinomyces mirandus]|uniref:Uncharacterized protein n=1 Tax=Thermoactinomyces mirandus TaxID=2756294 RepID=A0A7W2ASQ0_9BACL|nr:hypothetical protein [Thermoactinomyces mirandus]MBA4603652.1 hypothetical protein [Thermoactinomyces mirandus]